VLAAWRSRVPSREATPDGTAGVEASAAT
jgi:hypothetical protein